MATSFKGLWSCDLTSTANLVTKVDETGEMAEIGTMGQQGFTCWNLGTSGRFVFIVVFCKQCLAVFD